jgi:hypothetical protein
MRSLCRNRNRNRNRTPITRMHVGRARRHAEANWQSALARMRSIFTGPAVRKRKRSRPAKKVPTRSEDHVTSLVTQLPQVSKASKAASPAAGPGAALRAGPGLEQLADNRLRHGAAFERRCCATAHGQVACSCTRTRAIAPYEGIHSQRKYALQRRWSPPLLWLTLCPWARGACHGQRNRRAARTHVRPVPPDLLFQRQVDRASAYSHGCVLPEALECARDTHAYCDCAGEKPYKCDQCPQAFAERTNLTSHRRTHTGVSCLRHWSARATLTRTAIAQARSPTSATSARKPLPKAAP